VIAFATLFSVWNDQAWFCKKYKREYLANYWA